MPSYSFYIYNTTYFDYNSGTNSFELDEEFTPKKGVFRVEVRDDDSYMDGSGDSNQIAKVTDLSGNAIASGQLGAPEYADLYDPKTDTNIFIDRIEIDGVRVGYYPETELKPGGSYSVVDSAAGGFDHSYFEANNLPCFGPGAQVRTIKGWVLIAELSVGDLVLTRDHGAQPVRWIGQAEVCAAELATNPTLHPIAVDPQKFGAVGRHDPLLLSGNHRLLLAGAWPDLLFGASEVFAAAAHLLDLDGIASAPSMGAITYTHVLCDHHEVIEVNGVWVETLLAGPMALAGLPGVLHRRVKRLGQEMAAARPCLTRHEAVAFCAITKQDLAA